MKNIYYLILSIVLLIVVFTVYQQCQPDYRDGGTQTTVKTDTTTIDSLQTIIDYYESIPEASRDTVRDTVYIEKPVQINDSTNRYINMYSDSTLDATITSEVSAKPVDHGYVGVLTHQVLTYQIKQRRVREVTNTVTLNTVTTVTKTKTLIENSKPYFTVGAEVGRHVFGPTVGFTNPGQYQLFYRYDLNHGSHSVGFAIPIQF